MVTDLFERQVQTLLKQHIKIMTFPSWEQIFEIEYVRTTCNDVNMFIHDEIIARCSLLKLHHALSWVKTLQEYGILLTNVFTRAIKHYEKIKGSSSTWFLHKKNEK